MSMRLDLAIYDTTGKTRGYACVRLDFSQDRWILEEDAQRAWRSAGFGASGPFEMVDDDVVWLWDQELGNAKYNTAVLSRIALDATEAGQSGGGRIVTGQVGHYHGGTLRWTVIEGGVPLAANPLALVAGNPEFGCDMPQLAA
jgi:hypothetical protein